MQARDEGRTVAATIGWATIGWATIGWASCVTDLSDT